MDPAGRYGREMRDLQRLLTQKFGGVTAYTQSPARGEWQAEAQASVVRDDLIIVETMAAELEREWWKALKMKLEASLQQKELLVRVLPMEQL